MVVDNSNAYGYNKHKNKIIERWRFQWQGNIIICNFCNNYMI